MAHAQSLDRLATVDRRLSSRVGTLGSLSPSRERATPLALVGEHFLTVRVDRDLGIAFATALSAVVEAQAEAFPGNLFWDYDYPAARLFSRMQAAPEQAVASTELIVSLHQTFGVRSRIQFSYAHDFIYGFDWARWVERNAEHRSHVGPLDPVFLEYLLGRGRELLSLIANDDATYPALPEGQARNSFGFLRDPRSERRLHEDLAERNLIPVQAWRFDAEPMWQQPFARLREERARALGLWVHAPGRADGA